MMNDDAIERALCDEPEISPSLGFSHRVMRSVREESTYRQAIPFPWKPFAAGLGVSAAAILLVAFGGVSSEAAIPFAPERLVEAVGVLTATLIGTAALSWLSVRYVRPR